MNRNRLKPLTLSTSSPLVASGGTALSKSPVPTLSEIAAKRRSSFSYRRSEDVNTSTSISSNAFRGALPTPESTPTTSERPLSPSEQAFLFNNQASLLARISELERVLACRSRPMSFVSTSSRQLSTSSIVSECQNDEMLRLVQDLKMERDELSRDLSVSQSKVENLEAQLTLLNRRIESERKETWITKQSEQTLKFENGKLSKELDTAKLQILRLEEDLVKAQDKWQSRDVFHLHRKDDSLPRSVERGCFPEDVTRAGSEDDEDELAHYEDEDIGDVSFYSDQDDSNSSTSLQGSLLRPTALFGHPIPSPSTAASVSPPSTPSSAPILPHKRSSSLEKGWSFPKGARPAKTTPPKVDRFFDCLEILDNDDLTQSSFASVRNSQSQDKYGFFSGQEDEDEDDFPFMLPSQAFPTVGAELTPKRLDVPPETNHFQLTPPLSPSTPSISTPFQSGPVDPSAVRGLMASQIGRLPLPSLIPKPSPPRTEVSTTYLTTPTSVPRVKISPVTPPAATKFRDQRELSIKSPSKLPQPRSATNTMTQSASSPSSGFQILKGSSMGLTALANYLPWTSWSGEDAKTKSTKEEVTARNVQRSTKSPIYTPLRRGLTSKTMHNSGNTEQLILL